MTKEKDIEKLMKQSVLTPSDHFTDELMHNIYLQSQVKSKINWKIGLLSLACMLIFILSFYISFPHINILKFSVRFSPMVIPIFSIAFIFYELTQIIEIIKYRNNNMVNRLLK